MNAPTATALPTNPLLSYTLHLADNALILGHRNSEWCAHGPALEQDIALTNISLDLIGQARLFFQYAATLQGHNTTEDTLAYCRDVPDFKNNLITELPNGNWAYTITRQFLFSEYQYCLYQHLQNSSNPTLASIAQKALKEVTYHIRWSAEWVIRLGDGTEESHRRMQTAVNNLWPYTGELFTPAPYETAITTTGILNTTPQQLNTPWLQKVKTICTEATLTIPEPNTWFQQGGKTGRHSEHLGYILGEMQFLQRAYPNSQW